MTYETIRLEEKHNGQVLEIFLNVPPANILSEKMIREIEQQIVEETKNQNRKLIVFSGTGAHFSYGASVEEHLPGKVESMLPTFHRLMVKIVECPVPTLAKVTGLCLGGAFELALCCSFIFADERAKFGVPEIQLGVFPPIAAAILPALCSSTLLNEMILTGDRFEARYLCDRGVINRACETQRLDTEVATFTEKHILPKSASSLRIAHQAARMSVVNGFKEKVQALEDLYLGKLMRTADAQEGLKAFVEKRQAKWQNV